MTNKEKIIAEIERLTEVTGYALSEYENGRRSAMYDIRKQLIEYINSLPTEQPSEDLDINEELQRFFEINNLYVDIVDLQTIHNYNGNPTNKIYYFEDVARHFAHLQKERVVEKACNWLNKNVVEYHPRTGELKPVVNLNAFREAMEGK